MGLSADNHVGNNCILDMDPSVGLETHAATGNQLAERAERVVVATAEIWADVEEIVLFNVPLINPTAP